MSAPRRDVQPDLDITQPSERPRPPFCVIRRAFDAELAISDVEVVHTVGNCRPHSAGVTVNGLKLRVHGATPAAARSLLDAVLDNLTRNQPMGIERMGPEPFEGAS